MAISYDDWKKQYEGMTTEQQAKYAGMVKGNATAEEYANRYIQERGLGNTNSNSSTNQNNTVNNTQWTNTQPTTQSNQNQTNQNGTTYDFSNNQSNLNNQNNQNNQNTNNNQNQGGSPLSDGRNGDGNTYGKFVFDADEYLDKSKFGKTDGTGIQVKEGTAAQTGRPDYTAEDTNRLNEMIHNLNEYRNTNPSFFNDRETFNRVFEYNQRESQAQRDLLDSYWKKAQDYKKASSYNNSSSFGTDLDNGNISESEFEALKQYNQDVYIKWQQDMQNKLNSAIANLANPFSIDDMTTALNKIVEKFNLQAGDPYKVIEGWEDMMKRTGAWDSMKEAQKQFTDADATIAKIKSIQKSYSNSTSNLSSARMNKALEPYISLLSNQLSSGQHWQNLYQTQSGTANDYANTIVKQGQEDTRAFNDKLRALNFAMTADSYRTPEQQAQLQLQTQQIQNDMSLLNQSKLNDLSLYNQYATAKMQNQLNYEMQDLTVTDPKQLRANLSNVLDQWYSQYGDIIQRPKSQVIEDVLAYANEKGISVGQALRENFIEKLMEKPEYTKMMNNKLGIKEDTYNYTIDENGNIKITGTGTGKPDLESLRGMGGSGVGTMRTERNNNPTAMTSDVARSLGGVEGVDYIIGDEFPNNPNLHTAYLLGDPIEKTIELLDRAASTGRGAFYTKGGKQRWTHTAMSDSAWLALTDEEKKNVVLKMLHNEGGDISKMAYYNNGQGNSNGIGDSFEWKNSTYDLSKYSERNSLNDTEKELVKGLLSYTIDPNSLPKSGSENGKTNAKVRAAASVIGRDTGYTEQKYKTTQTIRTNWEKSLQQGGEASRNATAMSVLKSIAESFDSLNNTDFTYVNQLVNWMKKQNGDTDVVALDADVTIAASEMAGALKGNASPTDPEISAMKDLLSGKLSYNQAMEVIKKSAKGLFDKHESEAKGYYDLFGEKPNPIWVDDVADWMSNDLGINLGRYYNYDTVTAEDLRQKYFPNVKPAFNITATNGSLDYTGAAMAVLNA